MTTKTEGLALLRQPFPENQISKLPKPTKAQTDAVRADFKKGVRCKVCGTWHHPDVVHLDYVGHAAATDRLLDADPRWTWEPVPDPAAMGLPTSPGGMWIKLTVDGVSRYGFGSADGKAGGDAIKEIIGDAIRNAGMRFGMALDLWHKGDLHADEADEKPATDTPPRHDPTPTEQPAKISAADRILLTALADKAGVQTGVICESYKIKDLADLPAFKLAKLIERLEGDAAARAPKPELEAILADDVPF